MKRTASALIASALLLCSGIGLMQHTSSDTTDQGVAISTAITAQRCSTDCGKADEPATAAGQAIVVGCGWAMDDMPETLVVSSDLVSKCDYRVTGEACPEDELCAQQEIRSEHDYRALSATELGFIHDQLNTYVDTDQACVLGVAEVEITEVRAGRIDWQGASDDAGDALLHPAPTC